VKHFFVKLIPPRPTFHIDMSERERLLMDEHAIYWKDLQEQGVALIYGPVFDPDGVWGLGVIRSESEDKARISMNNDPTIKAHLNTFELVPMNAFMKSAIL
jgi:uncharacterized protein